MFRGFKCNFLLGMGVFYLIMFTTSTGPAYGFGSFLNKVGKTLDQASEVVDTIKDPGSVTTPKPTGSSKSTSGTSWRDEIPLEGKTVFSKSPIDPDNPTNLETSFQSGDYIYGLIQLDKKFIDFFINKYTKDRVFDQLNPMLRMSIDDGNESYQNVYFKNPEDFKKTYIVAEVAPDPVKMTSYKNPDITFGEGKGNLKIGPMRFTSDLSQMAPGTHKVKVCMSVSGADRACGSFEISGNDFKFYEDLHNKIKAESDAHVTMPKPGMIDKEMEGQMKRLLQNAGWSNVLRVVIVDKGWLNDRDKNRRYLNAVAAAKQKDGKCYWSQLIFSQNNWPGSKLELIKIGDKRNITEANVYK